MGREQRKSKLSGYLGNRPSPSKDGEYDLERNIRKINSYSKQRRGDKRHRESITSSYDEGGKTSSSQRIVENADEQALHSPTGEISWSSFTRLDDKITVFSEKNDKAHTELRRELEDKINGATAPINDKISVIEGKFSKYLHIYWYGATISALIVIVSIWYQLSYKDVHPLPLQFNKLDDRVKSVEQKLQTILPDSMSMTKKRDN